MITFSLIDNTSTAAVLSINQKLTRCKIIIPRGGCNPRSIALNMFRDLRSLNYQLSRVSEMTLPRGSLRRPPGRLLTAGVLNGALDHCRQTSSGVARSCPACHCQLWGATGSRRTDLQRLWLMCPEKAMQYQLLGPLFWRANLPMFRMS